MIGRRAKAAGCGLSLIAVLAVMLASRWETPAGAQCLPAMCGFTENGKKGVFIKTRVTEKAIAKNDAAIAATGSKEGLLAAQSVNRGQLFGTGLYMPETERRLSAVIEEFRPAWSYRQVDTVRVRIVGSSSFIPQSFADNVIVVPFGVLSRAKSDGQVAWLLGHEFSHLAMAHFAREARAKKRSRAIGQIIGTVDTLTALSQTRASDNGGKLRLYNVEDKQAIALSDSIWAKSQQLQDGLALIDAFFSRGDEDRADVAGLDFAVSAGYAYGGAIDALEIIANDEKKTAVLFDEIATATGEYAKKTGLATLGALGNAADVKTGLTSWVKDLAANAAVVAVSFIKKKYLQQHRPPEKRIEGLRKYYTNAYKDDPGRPPSQKLLKELRATQEYRDADIAVSAYSKAVTEIEAMNGAKAALELQPALQTRYARTPYIANLQARIADIQGDLRAADAAYSRAEQLPSEAIAPARVPVRRGKGRKAVVTEVVPTASVARDPYLQQNLGGFVAHVTLLVRMGNYAKALAVIAVAKERFNDDQAFLPNYIAIYTATRQPELLIATLNRCLDVADPGIEQGCRAAMLNDKQQKALEQMSPVDQAKVAGTLARASSKAKSGGLMGEISEALSPDDKDDGDD